MRKALLLTALIAIGTIALVWRLTRAYDAPGYYWPSGSATYQVSAAMPSDYHWCIDSAALTWTGAGGANFSFGERYDTSVALFE